jgi:hypothetical protein
MAINLPENSEDIIERIFENTKLLIRYNYWDGISETTFCKWFNNFETLDERYLAAAILSSLIYRNQISIQAFGAQLFQITIPNYLEKHSIHTVECIDSWMQSLNHSRVSKFPFRFSTLEGIDDKPGKSGSAIFRSLKKTFFNGDLGVGTQAYEKILKNKNIKILILFDDILGTGRQFDTYMKKFNPSEYKVKILYCPFVAQKDGIKFINTKYPSVDIIPIETIDNTCGLFSKTNKLFSLCDNTEIEEFKSLYINMTQKKEFKISGVFGEGDQALTFLFNDSTPNNNIAALWYQDDNWNQLVKR